MLIPRAEVLGRLQGGLDFGQLNSTPEWKQMNVLGQIEVVWRVDCKHRFELFTPSMHCAKIFTFSIDKFCER